MKKKQNKSIHAAALQIALALALVSISAVLLASSFKDTTSNTGSQPDDQRADVIRIVDPVSQNQDPSVSDTRFDVDSSDGPVIPDDSTIEDPARIAVLQCGDPTVWCSSTNTSGTLLWSTASH